MNWDFTALDKALQGYPIGGNYELTVFNMENQQKGLQ